MAKTSSSNNYITIKRPLSGNPIKAITYDTKDRPISITYQFTSASLDATQTLTFSYSDEGFITFKGVEYRNYRLDIWEATLLPVDTDTEAAEAAARAVVSEDQAHQIILELKKMNTYFAIMLDHKL